MTHRSFTHRGIRRGAASLIGAAVLGSVATLAVATANHAPNVVAPYVAPINAGPDPLPAVAPASEETTEMSQCAKGTVAVRGTCAWDATSHEAILTPAKPIAAPKRAVTKPIALSAPKHATATATQADPVVTAEPVPSIPAGWCVDGNGAVLSNGRDSSYQNAECVNGVMVQG